MQTLGTLLAVLTVGWAMHRSAALKALAAEGRATPSTALYYWIRYVIPGAILLVGIWWLLTDVLGIVTGV
jgi:SNF family Na+-dependent transporter